MPAVKRTASAAAAPAAGAAAAPGAATVDDVFAPAKKKRADLSPRDRAAKAAECSATARLLAMDRKDKEAYQGVLAALRYWPYDAGAYDVLATLLARNGDRAGAVQARMLQAQSTRSEEKRRRLYHELYQTSQELGLETLAVHNLAALLKLINTKAAKTQGIERARMKRQAVRLNHQRLVLLERIGEWKMVEQGYRLWIMQRPFDTRAVLSLCQVFNKLAMPEKAVAVAEAFLQRCVKADRVPCDEDPIEGAPTCQGFLNVCNMAAELHLDAGRFGEVKEIVKQALQLLRLGALVQLHPDLIIKHCIANLYLGEKDAALRNFAEAQEHLEQLAEGDSLDALGFGELFFDFSQTLLKLGLQNEAREVLSKIRDQTAPIVLFSLAKCHAGRAQQLSVESAAAGDSGDTQRSAASEAEALEEWRQAEGHFARVHAACPENVETRACLAEARVAIGGDSAVDSALRLLSLDSVGSWTPEDTLRASYQTFVLLRKIAKVDAAREVAADILQACQKPEPAGDRAAGQRAGRFEQLCEVRGARHKRQRPRQSVLIATRVTRPLPGSTQEDGPPVLAQLQVGSNEDRGAVLAAQRDMVQDAQRRGAEEKAVFSLRPLATRRREDARRQSVPGEVEGAVPPAQRPNDDIANLASLEEDMLVHEFLSKSNLLRRVVNLAESDVPTDADSQSVGSNDSVSPPGSDEPDAGSDCGARSTRRPALTAEALRANQAMLPDTGDRIESYILNEFFTSLPRRFDGAGPEEGQLKERDDDAPSIIPRFPRRAAAGRQQSRWHSGTVRRVLVNGDVGRDSLFSVLRGLVDEPDGRETDPSTRMEVAQRAVPLLHTAVANRYRLFTGEEQDCARQILVATCFNLGDFKVAYTHIRRLVGQRQHHTNHFWNVLNALLLSQGPRVDLRALFDTLRFHQHLMQCFPLFCILGNAVAYRHGSTKLAIGPLLQAFRLNPNDAMVALMISLQYLKLVMSRNNPNRHYVALQAFAFADTYGRLRRGLEEGQSPPDQPVESEVWYNSGRVYHQLGLNREAADYYRRCLTLRERELERRSVAGEQPSLDDELASMHREAAYNLHLILLKSGNVPYANYILRTHIVV
eukprot:Hpha_TRINITY_DN10971_c1_g1::TRINITY_DN10971_c1_g1_i1::g.26997::m.26997/K15201/GTP3C3, TFC4; general transcription factor 3C polypeptide 3 (transcription factor C subunit 4)